MAMVERAFVAAAISRHHEGRRPDATVPTSAHVTGIKQTFDVLERAVTDVPTLTALATMPAMSRSHLSRTFHYDLPHLNKVFRRRLGMSPTQFRVASPGPSTT